MIEKVPVKVKKLHPDAVIPKYMTPGSAGFDLVAVEDVIIQPGETKKVRLGLAFEIPPGYEIQIRPRSGISLRTKLRQSNSVGTIDCDYRGEVHMLFDNIAEPNIYGDFVYTLDGGIIELGDDDQKYPIGTYLIRKGDRICQGVLQKVPVADFVEVDELSDTERGVGGFGSTGRGV